jgi:hypothetical protein
MLHRVGSSHGWVAGGVWDLSVTVDGTTGEIYAAFMADEAAFMADEEGTMAGFRGLAGVIARRGLFCALYTGCRLGFAPPCRWILHNLPVAAKSVGILYN